MQGPRFLEGVSHPNSKHFYYAVQLAKELGEDIGYRRVETLAMTAKGGVGKTRKRRLAELPEWVDGPGVSRVQSLGGTETTAQVS